MIFSEINSFVRKANKFLGSIPKFLNNLDNKVCCLLVDKVKFINNERWVYTFLLGFFIIGLILKLITPLGIIFIYLISIYCFHVQEKINLHKMYNNKIDVEFIKEQMNKTAKDKLMITLISIFIINYLIITDNFISLPMQVKIYIDYITAIYFIVAFIFIFSIRYNSIITKTFAFITMNVFVVILPIYIPFIMIIFNALKMPNNLFEKCIYLLSYLFSYKGDIILIFIIVLFAVIISSVYVIFLPYHQIKKTKIAHYLLNIVVLLVTFFVFLSAPPIANKKEIILKDMNKTHDVLIKQTLEQIESISDNKVKEKQITLIEEGELEYRDAYKYVGDFTSSNVRDLCYVLLFPYLLINAVISLIIYLKEDKYNYVENENIYKVGKVHFKIERRLLDSLDWIEEDKKSLLEEIDLQ